MRQNKDPGALQQRVGSGFSATSTASEVIKGHQFAPFHFDDPHFLHREYETLQAYGQSKTAINLLALELDNRAR